MWRELGIRTGLRLRKDNRSTQDDGSCGGVGTRLDVLHITLVDLDNDVSAEHLAEVSTAARDRGLDLELNVSIDAPCDPRVNASVEESLHIGHAISAQLVTFSLDIKRPKPIYGSCMHPDVVVQLADRVYEFKKNIPLIENYGMKIALENHCD